MDMKKAGMNLGDMLNVQNTNSHSDKAVSSSNEQFGKVMKKQLQVGKSAKEDMVQNTKQNQVSKSDVAGVTKTDEHPAFLQENGDKRKLELQTLYGEDGNVMEGQIENLEELDPTQLEMVAAYVTQAVVDMAAVLQLPTEEVQLQLQQLDSSQPLVMQMQQMVLQAAQEENPMTILTDENLGKQFAELQNIAEETLGDLAENLQITPEEAQTIMNQFVEGQGQNVTEQSVEVTVQEVVDGQASTQAQNLVPELEKETISTSTPQDQWKKEATATMTVSAMENPQQAQPLPEQMHEKTLQEVMEEPAVTTSVEKPLQELMPEQESVETFIDKPEKMALSQSESQSNEVIETLAKVAEPIQEVKSNTNETEVKKEYAQAENTTTSLEQTTASTASIESDTKQENGNQESAGKEAKENKTMLSTEQFVANFASIQEEQVASVEEHMQTVQQVREIVQQVVEQIRVQVTADTSEMHLQLNPENLGKVHLSVAMKDGHVTAQFVTENALAKQALESQIQQLRDTLSEQGMKVDRVEVSVSDFDFAQGNQANAEEQKEQQKNNMAKSLQRNLKLSDITDDINLTEAEQVAVQMMRSNGGQVDYIA